jgi:hypothetical protein
MHHTGLSIDSDAQVTAALYSAGDKAGIALGEGSRSAGGGGLVSLVLEPAALEGRRPGQVTLHRQDGTSQALNLQGSPDALSLEVRLERWEAAVVEIEKL